MFKQKKDLYKASRAKLLQALRDGGVTRENVSSSTKIYEAKDGSIKATNGPIEDPRKNEKSESIGFWLWTSGEEYDKAQDSFQDIFHKVDAGFEVNLAALKKLL